MTWFTAGELAEMGLPGLPATQRRVNATADREGWRHAVSRDGSALARRRRDRGGGWEYHVSLLPEAARAALLTRRQSKAQPAENTQDQTPPARAGQDESGRVEQLWQRYKCLPDHLKQRAQSRLGATQSIELLLNAGVKKMTAYQQVAQAHGASVTQLRQWWRKVEGERRDIWLPLLADNYVAGGQSTECTPYAWEVYKSDYLRPEKPSHAQCYRRLQRRAEAEGWTIPDASTMRRWIERLPGPVITLAREGEESLKRKFPSQQRDRSVFHALEAVNADGHTFDVFVRWPDGTVGRPVMLAWQDLYSGKILSWRIGQSENADLVRLALGDMVDTYGIPDDAYLDNGRAFASKWMTGGMAFRHRFKVKQEEPSGIMTSLGIRVHWVTPYHGQAKPIERAFRDLCDAIAKHPSCSGAYTGNKPDAKPENYGSKAVALADFIELVTSEIRHHNARTGRRTQVCAGGKSFDQAFQESYAQSPIKQATSAQQDLWLLAAEGVKVRVDGTVHLMGNRYWSEPISRYAGHQITARFDPDALHEGLHVYSRDGAFIGYAPCFEAAGFNDTQAAREQQRAWKAWKKAQREMLNAERRLSAAEVAKGLPAGEDETPTPAPSVVKPASFGRGNAAPALQAEQANDADEQEDPAVRQLRGLRLIHGGNGTAGD